VGKSKRGIKMVIDNQSKSQASNSMDSILNYVNNSGVDSTERVNRIEKDSEVSEEKRKEYNKEELDRVVGKLNELLEPEPSHAEYSVHKDFGTIMIKIVSDETNKVILEIPSEKVLDMLASMCRNMGLFDKKA
jgi:flagellar protein FlaG